MELKTILYDAKAINRTSFKKDTSAKNIIYLFYKDDECLYIGETGTSLYDRIFVNTPKEKSRPWFIEGNLIHVIRLDDNIDDFARQTIESVFITLYRPKYNKKA